MKDSLLRGSLVYLFSNILNAAIPFALLPVLTRHLSTVEYGQVAMFQTLLAALVAFVGLNTSGAAIRKYYDSDASNVLAEYVGACLQILVLSALIISLLFYPLRGMLSSWFGISTLWITVAVCVAMATFTVRLRLGQWQVRKKAVNYGLFQISLSTLNLMLSLIFVVVLGKGADGRIAGQAIATAVFAIIAFLSLYRDKLVRMSVQSTHVRDAMAYGIPLIPHVSGIFLLSAIDRFLINAELGIEHVAVYVVAAQMAMVMAVCFDAFNKAYVPWIFERLSRDNPEEKMRIVRWTYIYFVAVLLIAILMFWVGPTLVVIIAGEKYAAAGKVIGWLAVGQAFHGMYLMVTNYVLYSKKTGLLSLSTFLSGMVNVLLVVVLIRAFGMEGAGIAFSISMAIRFFATWIMAQTRHPMPWLG